VYGVSRERKKKRGDSFVDSPKKKKRKASLRWPREDEKKNTGLQLTRGKGKKEGRGRL